VPGEFISSGILLSQSHLITEDRPAVPTEAKGSTPRDQAPGVDESPGRRQNPTLQDKALGLFA
jgi:hypothetical protein